MKRKIILLCNTCPYGGEVFLRNELDYVPANQSVTLFPILATDSAAYSPLPEHIELQTVASRPAVWDYLTAGFKSFWALLRQRELAAVFRHKQPLRNFVKALKFGCVAESRVRRIRRWIDANAPGEPLLFYSYWLYEAAYVAARLKALYPGSRFVSRCHGFDLYQVRHPNGYLPYREYILSSADGVFPISDDGKAYISRIYGGKWDKKTQVMRLGTADHGLNPASSDSVVTLVSCSNLVEVKRVDRIIQALAQAEVPLRWYHFGDGELRRSLEDQAKALPAHVEWKFMGFVPNGELMDFYRTHHVDAFLNVSASEGVPVSIMEALSFGIPAVATDVGGTHEILEDGHNGRLLRPDFGSHDLLEAILEVAQSETMGPNVRRLWEQKCDAPVNYRRFYKYLEER